LDPVGGSSLGNSGSGSSSPLSHSDPPA
jgi:hypothetical protein